MKIWSIAVLISLLFVTAPIAVQPRHAPDENPSFCTLDLCGSGISITAGDAAVILEWPDGSFVPGLLGFNLIPDCLFHLSPLSSGEYRPPRT